MELLSYFRLFRSRWLLIVVPTIVGAVIGAASWAVTNGVDDSASYYRATHTATFEPPPSNSTWAFQNVHETALLATGGEVLARVADRFGDDAADLSQRVVTRSDATTNALEISVDGQDPDTTAQLAETLGTELQQSVATEEQAKFAAERDGTTSRMQNLAAELSDLDAQLAAGGDRDLLMTQRQGVLNQYWFNYEQFQQLTSQGTPKPRLSTFDVATAVPIGGNEYDAFVDLAERGDNNIRVDESSETAELPRGSTWRDGALPRGLLGGFLGFLLGLGLAYGADRIHRPLRSREEIEAALEAPVVAEIPRLGKRRHHVDELVTRTMPRSRTAEAYRSVRSLVLRELEHRARSAGDTAAAAPSTEGRGRVVMVTSASPGEGTTSTAANLAVIFAEAGDSVLAVSCGLDHPGLGRLLGAVGEAGAPVETALSGVRCVTQVTDDPSTSPPRVLQLLRTLIDEERQRADVVVLDTPPLLSANDATELMPLVDAVVLVARTGVTTLGAAEDARTLLERISAPVAGIVVIDQYRTAKDAQRTSDSGSEPVTGAAYPPAGSRTSNGSEAPEEPPAVPKRPARISR